MENICSPEEFQEVKVNDQLLYESFNDYALKETNGITVEQMTDIIRYTFDIKDLSYLRYLYLYQNKDEIAINFCNLSNKCSICLSFKKEFIELHKDDKSGIVHKVCSGCFPRLVERTEVKCPICREDVTKQLEERGIIVIEAHKQIRRADLTEEELIQRIRRDPNYIQYIRNPTEAVQLAAVRQDGDYIQYIRNPTEAVQLAAVRYDGDSIQYIRNPSEAVQLAAVRSYAASIQYIQNPTEEVQLAAVRQNSNTIIYIQNPFESVLSVVYR